MVLEVTTSELPTNNAPSEMQQYHATMRCSSDSEKCFIIDSIYLQNVATNFYSFNYLEDFLQKPDWNRSFFSGLSIGKIKVLFALNHIIINIPPFIGEIFYPKSVKP